MTVQPLAAEPDTRNSPTFLTSLRTGQLDWDTLCDFPEQSPAERARGDAMVAKTLAFLDARTDPDAIDLSHELPTGLLPQLHDLGCFTLGTATDLGGLALPPYSVFRVIEAAASRSAAIGLMLGVHNGIGVGAALLPALPDGPLRDLIRRRTAEGMVSGWADAEPAGQGNQWPTVTATPTDDGSAYVLHGDKLFITNGSVADLLGVTVTVQEAGRRQVGLAVVDTLDPGYTVVTDVEYLGARGLPNVWLRLDGATVPRDHVITVATGDPRYTPRLASAVLTARLYIKAAPALAIARNCLRWSREFAARRRIDGTGLGEYDLIQRMLADTMADVHAMDSVIRWSLAAPDPGDRWFERLSARNICTAACTRVVDRTVSLLGGEGLETVRSKQRRGAEPVPLERAFRDARILRTAGGVDFLADLQAANVLLSHMADGDHGHDRVRSPKPAPRGGTDGLSLRNAGHLRTVLQDLRRFRLACSQAAGVFPVAAEPRTRQHKLVLLNRIAAELFTMAAVLARTAGGGSTPLADIYCTAAAFRLRDLWARLEEHSGPDHAAAGHSLLSDTGGAQDLLAH